jgi:subtilisin family serine protease
LRTDNQVNRLTCVFSVLIVVFLVTSVLVPLSFSSVGHAAAETSQTIIVQGENAHGRNQTDNSLQNKYQSNNPSSISGMEKSGSTKIEPQLSKLSENIQGQLKQKGEDETVRIIVRLEPADLTGVPTNMVVVRLKEYADRTQEQVIEFLQMRGAKVLNKFWLANAILAEANVSTIRDLTSFSSVENIHEDFQVSTLELVENSSNGLLNSFAPPSGVREASQDKVPEVSGGIVGISSTDGATWGLNCIRAPDTWALGINGSGIRVAVLDTGVDITHPDLVGKMWTDNAADPTYPGGWIEFDSNGNIVFGSTPHDTAGHGTHTSGTVLGDNASGTAIGVAPGAWLMHALILPGGSGSFAQCIAGMEWAIDPVDQYGNPAGQRADVASMSWGADGHYDEMIEPIVNMKAAGVVPVAAIGNSGEGISSSPGNVYEAFGIGAIAEDNSVAYFSEGEVVNWPASYPEPYIKPDFSAPGVDVYSSVPGGGYAYWNGTSMATPHVSGTIALMLEANPLLTVDDIYDTLKSTSDDLGSPGKDTRYGWGVINAFDAVVRVQYNSGIEGYVIDASTSNGIAGAKLVVQENGWTRYTSENGYYRIFSPPDDYTLTVSAYGYYDNTVVASVIQNQYTVLNITLAPLPRGSIAGEVTDNAFNPIENATVTLLGTPLSTRTDDVGSYVFEAPIGTYDVKASAWGYGSATAYGVEVLENQTTVVNFQLGPILLSENFDNYATGTFPLGWGKVYSGRGWGYCIIDNSQAFSPPNSWKLEGMSNWSQVVGRRLPNPPDPNAIYDYSNGLPADEYAETVEWLKAHPIIWVEARVMTGVAPAHSTTHTLANIRFYKVLPLWGLTYGGIWFNHDPLTDNYFISAGENRIPYEPYHWYDVRVQTDLLNRTYNAWVDNELIAEDVSVEPNEWPEMLTLCADNPGDFTVAWFDDVKIGYTQYEHDLGVSLVAPRFLDPGDSTLLEATVHNVGLENENNIELQLLIDNTIENSITIPELPAGTSYTLSYLWTPTVEGTYEVEAYAPPVLGEEYTANNQSGKFVGVFKPVRAVVLDSWGTDYASETFWDYLNANWTNYGDKRIMIDYTSLNKDDITLADIEATQADVLIISDAWNYYAGWEFTDSEIDAIKTYVLSGHGIIATSGTFDSYYAPNNRKLAELFGMDPSVFYYWGTSTNGVFDLLTPRHDDLWRNVPNPYPTGYQYTIIPTPSSDWTSQGVTSGWIEALSRDHYAAVITNEGNRAVYFTYIPEYLGYGIVESTNQLFYNSIVWAGSRYKHDLSVSLVAPGFLKPGDSTLLEATVYNIGLENENNVELQLLIDNTIVDSVVIPELDVGSSYTLSYPWTPTVEETYEVEAYAPPVPGEEYTGNNTISKTVNVQVLPDTLIVSDDDAFSYVHGTSLPEFESALTAAGQDYFEWKESTMGHPPLEFLTMFKLVIWTCGDYWSWAVDPTDAETLEAYLAQGGNIILEGEDIGFNHYSDNFMVNVAHAIYQVDDTGAPGLTVTDPTHPVTQGLPTTFSWLQNPPYDDGVTPTNGGFEVIQYTGTSWTAVTVFDGEGTGYGSVVYYAFPIYCLGQSERDMLVINSANWITRPVHVSILPRYQEGLPRTTLEYTVTVINGGELEDNYDLVANDNSGWALTLSENQLENVLPHENRMVTLSVTIPQNATPGTEDKITVTVTSQENAQISDNAICVAHTVEFMTIIQGKDTAYNLDFTWPPPWVWYYTGNNPPILAAGVVGDGAIVAGGTACTCRNGRWNVGEWDVFLDTAFQWMVPGATKVLWYEGYGVFNDTTQCSDLVTTLTDKGYTITGDSTEPITSSLLAPYDILVIPELELGASGTGGDPTLLPDADVAAIKSFVEGGKGLLIMEGSDYGGFNWNRVQNKILRALGFGLNFQSDELYDDTNYWGDGPWFPIADVNTTTSIGSAYESETGSNEIGQFSVCSLAPPPPARFDPPHLDNGLDTDNDNLYEYLVVEVKVAVDNAGWYEVYGDLYDGDGNYITYAWADDYLDVGTQTLELRFDGKRINYSGKDGPYLAYLNLYGSPYGWLDSDEHWTAAYTHDQFQPPAIFTGDHLKIGVSEFGELGTAGVGFQYPIGDSYESLAVGWQGDGYLVAYDGEIYTHYPDGPNVGTLTLVSENTIANTPDIAEHEVVVMTGDGKLKLTFLFDFQKHTKFVTVKTTITNISDEILNDVYYKRVTDWDVWSLLGWWGATNWWGWDENYNLGVAFLTPAETGSEYAYMGTAGYPSPTGYDLDAWDDQTSRGFGWSRDTTPITSPEWTDGCLGLHWSLGSLSPGASKDVYSIYAAGDTLSELREDVDNALVKITPDIWVEPTSLNVRLPPDKSENYTLTIGDNGNTSLTYDISDVETTTEAVERKITAQKITLPVEGPFSKSKDIVRYTVNLSDIEPTGDWKLLLTDPDESDIWMDIKEVYAKDDGSNIYFKVVFYEPWPGDPHGYIDTPIFLDTDQNQGTGLSNAQSWYPMNDIGADYAAVVGWEGDSVWKWDGGWIIPWAPFTYLHLDPYTNVFEVGISLNDIGNPNAIDLIVANIDIASGWKWDYAPIEGDGHVTYNIGDCPWLDENPKSGTVEPGNSNEITVSIDTTGLALGDYSANIIIKNNDPDENPKVVPVHLTVAPMEWDALITATFSGGSDDAIFGVRPDATSGFDSNYDIPEPPPPPKLPYVRAYFYYPEQTPDELHRSCLAPENLMEWPLRIKYADNIENITLTWNVENIPSEYSVLLYRGGDLVADMRAEDNYTFEASPGSHDFKIVVGTIVPFTLELTQGWNMISLPIMPQNPDPDVIFGGAYYVIYRWDAENRKYVLYADSESSIEPDPNVEVGVGYWVYVLENENVDLPGFPVNQLTLSLCQGWNLIGAPYGGSSIADPIDDPDNSVLPWAFTWNSVEKSYDTTLLLEAGKGYWIYALLGCELTLIGGK